MSRKSTAKSCKLRPSQPFSLTEFRTSMRNNFLYNLKSGILLDLTKKIDEHEIITRAGLEQALSEAETGVKSIDLFLADQLKENTLLDEKLKEITQKKQEKEKELNSALKKMGDLKVDLFKKIEGIRETMQCRNFLHTVSSQAWLSDYKVLAEKHNISNAPNREKLDKEFSCFMSHMGGMDKEVEKIVKEFIDIFQNSGPVLVPFKEGKDISGVIKKIEKNNMEMLIHIRRMQRPLAEKRKALNEINHFFNEEITEVVRTLKEITESYIFLKERNSRLESIIHDMMKYFKKQVVSEEVLKDRALLESLYKEVVKSKKPKPSALQMWKEIDEAFIDIRCKVGSFSKDEIERRRIVINKFNERKLKDAEKARNRVWQMEQMVKGVRKAFWAPALPGSRKPMRPRSEPPPAPQASPPPPSPPGEDYTLELMYQSKLVQPLAISYDLPKRSPSRIFFTRRDSVTPEGRNVDQVKEIDEEFDNWGLKETMEAPKLPIVEKFVFTVENQELQ